MSGTFDMRDGMRPVCHGVAVGDGRYGLVLTGPADTDLLEATEYSVQVNATLPAQGA